MPARWFPACALVLLAASGAASRAGDDGEERIASTYRALDADGSGSVEQNELSAFAAAHGLNVVEFQKEFRDLDTNANGRLDTTEMSAIVGAGSSLPKPARAGPASAVQTGVQPSATSSSGAAITSGVASADSAFRALDTDGSGAVEQNELAAFAGAHGLKPEEFQQEFRQLDTNGDGRLDATEMRAIIGADPASAVQLVAKAPEVAGAQASAAPALGADSPGGASSAAPVSVAETVDDVVSRAGTRSVAATNLTGMLEARLSKVEETAKFSAGRFLAERLARQAGEALLAKRQNDQKAAELEEHARSLWGNATVLLASASQRTSEAARSAADTVIQAAVKKIQGLEANAQKWEAQASLKRDAAKATMRAAAEAQKAVAEEVQKLRESDGLAPMSVDLLRVASF